MTNGQFPIWETPAEIFPTGARNGQDVDSPRANGRLFISRTAKAMISGVDEAVKTGLTTWLVDQLTKGKGPAKVGIVVE